MLPSTVNDDTRVHITGCITGTNSCDTRILIILPRANPSRMSGTLLFSTTERVAQRHDDKNARVTRVRTGYASRYVNARVIIHS